MVVKGNGTMGCRELLNFGDEMPVPVEWRSLNFGIIKDFIPWQKKKISPQRDSHSCPGTETVFSCDFHDCKNKYLDF